MTEIKKTGERAAELTPKDSITPGKQDDLVILSQNPLGMASEDVFELDVVETVSRGVSVYSALDVRPTDALSPRT